jgi:hypothetical protein
MLMMLYDRWWVVSVLRDVHMQIVPFDWVNINVIYLLLIDPVMLVSLQRVSTLVTIYDTHVLHMCIDYYRM